MSDENTNGAVLTADGTPLSVSLNRALRREKIRALLLIAPLLIFVMISFVIPIGKMLVRSVDNYQVTEIMPQTVEALKDWDEASGELPPEEIYAAFAADMIKAANERKNSVLGQRLNYDIPGIASKFRQMGRKVKNWDIEADAPFREKFIELDPYWGEVENWQSIKAYSGRITAGYFANAVDGRLGADGFEMRPQKERLFAKLLWTTLWMSALITLCTFLLGYPIAWILSNSKERNANLMMIMVLLPFWTSLLVRTAAWKVSLQDSGILNSLIQSIGLADSALPLMYNRFAVIVAMTHILLPFMILPMYSVMKTIPPTYLRAAKSMGATNWTAFWRVYFPQSIPGIGAGAILVFILAVGYYITPAIVGGTKGRFISNMIAYHKDGNWGLAAALGAILLIVVLVLYYIYDRIVGIDNVKLG